MTKMLLKQKATGRYTVTEGRLNQLPYDIVQHDNGAKDFIQVPRLDVWSYEGSVSVPGEMTLDVALKCCAKWGGKAVRRG